MSLKIVILVKNMKEVCYNYKRDLGTGRRIEDPLIVLKEFNMIKEVIWDNSIPALNIELPDAIRNISYKGKSKLNQ